MAGSGVGSIGAGAAASSAAKTTAPQTSVAKLDKNSMVDQLLKKHASNAQPVTLNVVTPTSSANSPASSGHVGTKISTSA